MKRHKDPCGPKSAKLKAARAWLLSRGITDVKPLHGAPLVAVYTPPQRRRLASV
jgi:hypothetical protein